MKSFKKALAVLLSALMVIMSAPISALALYNPENEKYPPGEEFYSTDYDVEVHAYVTNYDDEYSYGYAANTVEFFDPTQPLKKSDLSSPDGCFAVIITVEGLDDAMGSQLMFDVDTTQITAAQYGRRGLTTGITANGQIESGTDYGFTFDQTGTSSLDNKDRALVATNWQEQEPVSYTPQPYCGEGEGYDGMVLAVFGYQMLQDEINLQEALRFYCTTGDSYFSTDFPDNTYIMPYGAIDNYGQVNTVNTKFEFPEWGIVAPKEPTDVTYTYTFANGESEQVKAAAGVAPVAPENTANTAATSNNDGTHTYTTYSWPEWVDGTKEYTEVATPVTEDCDMQETTPATPPVHEDGQLIDGTTAVMTCSKCGYQTGGETVDAGEHDYQLSEELSTAATCVAKGENVYVCSVCGDTMTKATEIDPNNHANVVTDPEVPATCTTAGKTEGSHCEACSAVIVAQEEIPALGHDFSVQVGESNATCITPGTTTWKCSRCEETEVRAGEVNPNNHEGEIVSADNAVAPTRGEAGKEADKICNACHAVVEEGAVIPALGVQITVEQNELGTTTLNGEATTGAAQKVAYKDSYTLTATANEGAEFVGWQVNGKLVSTNATYTTAAYADLTYVPVFAEKTDDFTVTFVDQFNMVLGTYTSSQIAELEAMPNTHTYLGYTFANWSMTLEEVKALETNAIVTASYTKDDALTYTVSAPGCVITVGSETYNDTAEVGFDKAVTVAPAEGTATAWTVNGNNAAYGAEYTFYVTSDVEVAYSSEEVTAAPTVAGVDVTAVGDGSVRFLATRNVPEGYTLLESGYVYGKDFEDAEASLVLENANSTCYIYKNSNTAGDGQFALTFKIAAQTGVAYARAYVIAADAEGNAAVYYGNVQSFDYDA